MKRFLSVLLLTALLLSLISCDNSSGSGEAESSSLLSSEAISSSEKEQDSTEPETSVSEETASTETFTESSVSTETFTESSVSTETDSEAESSESNTVNNETTTEVIETTEAEGITEEETEMTYTEYKVENTEDMELVLTDSIIIKLGYGTAYVDGKRVIAFDEYTAPQMLGEKAVVYLDFVKEYLSLDPDAEDIVKNEYGDCFVSLDHITRVYTSYLYDPETGIIAFFGQYSPTVDDTLKKQFIYTANNTLALGRVFSAKMKGDRPILTVTDEQLEYAISKAKSGMDPWATAWEAISARADKLKGTSPSPDTGKSAQAYRLAACKDFINAKYLALAYLYTEDEEYLDSALHYLLSYAEPMLGTDKYLDYSAKTTDGQADIGLNIAAPLTAACDIYSLLYNHIDDADKETIEKWIREEADLCVKGHKFWIKNKYYGSQVGNNHLTSHLMGIIAAAYVLEDDSLLSYALLSADNPANLKAMITLAILMEGDEVYSADTDSDFTPGEIYDRYRVVSTPSNGFGYSLYHLKFLTNASLMLYNNGIDPFAYLGENGENISLPYFVYAEYLIKNDASLGNGHYTGNSLNRESAYTIYLIAYHIYRDERMSAVLDALESARVTCTENELYGETAPFLFGYFSLY